MGDFLLIGAHLRIPWESGVGFIISGLCLATEWRFFQHNKCCPHWIESLRGVRIVRGRTRRARIQDERPAL
jgi:hypothetical protein